MSRENTPSQRGLLIVNTGDGKGKTTAALGCAFRAAGHGMRVGIVQFIKGSWTYGELKALKRFDDLVDVHVMGRGFTWNSEDIEKDRRAAKDGWDTAAEMIQSGRYALVILDELTYLMTYGFVDSEDILAAIAAKPAHLHIIVTGRDASEQLIAAADLVTEMTPVKHPFAVGVKAQKGIEF
jgi:cob(I)alamin adenosyltransferase